VGYCKAEGSRSPLRPSASLRIAGVSNLRENFVKVRNFDKVIKTKEIHSNRFKSLPSVRYQKKVIMKTSALALMGAASFAYFL